MTHIKIKEGKITYPYSIQQLKSENPNTSFPQSITDDTLLEYGIHQVISVSKGSDNTKNYIELNPVLIDTNYYQNWQIVDATTEEIESRINNQWNQVRSIRNQYISNCDWTQLSDSPLTFEKKTEWAIYRQELRDITLQSDPFNIIWPTKPV